MGLNTLSVEKYAFLKKNEEFWPQNGPTWGHLVKIKKAIHKDGRV
ncbi:hypothetical protein Saga11_21310 [Bacillus safensis]|nr:hypothetical protein Saga11_21310 [Bacillus safensis]